MGKPILIRDNLNFKDRLILFGSEFIATAILVFLGCQGCVEKLSGGHIPHQQICLTFGLAVMVAVLCFGHISGSHINPIVTVAAVILGNLPLMLVPIYFAGQFLGAIAGYGLLMAVTPLEFLEHKIYNGTKVKPGVCSPWVNPDVSAFQACGVEFLISLLLVLTCCGVWDARNAARHDSVPIKFGLMIAVLAFTGGPYSGANMNPARSFAPALFNNDWENHWVYWVGPLSAAVVGATLYRFVFEKKPEPVTNIAETIPLNEKA